MIVYTCPKCGADLMFYCIDTYPPINVASCTHCGWRHKKRQEIEKVPYIVDITSLGTVLDTVIKSDDVPNATT